MDAFSIPAWFIGTDILLELLFGAITLLLSLTSYHIYRLANQREARLFGNAFVLISLSYFLWALLNGIIFFQVSTAVCQAFAISNARLLSSIGMLLHMVFFLAGLVTWTYTTLGLKNGRAYSLLLLMSLAWLILSYRTLWVFYALTTILFIYLLAHYLQHALKNKKAIPMCIAVILLLIGTFNFIFSVDLGLYYALGHFFELSAYVLILADLYLVTKK